MELFYHGTLLSLLRDENEVVYPSGHHADLRFAGQHYVVQAGESFFQRGSHRYYAVIPQKHLLYGICNPL